jgi:flagellar hook-associated protein 3 FlgL
MRVTGKIMRENLLRQVSSSMDRLQFIQAQMATGKRLLRPSVDPMSAAKALRTRGFLEDNMQFQRNVEDGLGWIDNVEPAVTGMVDLVTQIKELALGGADDGKTADQREVLALQIDRMLEEMVGLANTRYGQRYVFAGTHTLTQPYAPSYHVDSETVDLTGTDWVELAQARIAEGSVSVPDGMGGYYTEGVDYEIDYESGRIRRLPAGSMPASSFQVSYDTETVSSVDLVVADTDGDITREIAEGVHEKINIGGRDLFDSGTDVFAVLLEVKTALLRNDGAGVNASLDGIDDALDQINGQLGELGVMRNSFELAGGRLESEMVNLESLISNLEDADMAEVMVKYQSEQIAYEAALRAAASVMEISLINFVG